MDLENSPKQDLWSQCPPPGLLYESVSQGWEFTHWPCGTTAAVHLSAVGAAAPAGDVGLTDLLPAGVHKVCGQ